MAHFPDDESHEENKRFINAWMREVDRKERLHNIILMIIIISFLVLTLIGVAGACIVK